VRIESEAPVLSSPPDISRLWVLRRLPNFGVYLDHEEMEGFLRGDCSKNAPSHNFVLWAHGLGMIHSTDISPTPAMVLLYTRRVQITWERLVDFLGSKNYWECVRALILATSNTILHCMWQTSLLYIQKSCKLIKLGNLRFVPEYGPPPEFSEEVHKTLVPLSQTIYWANYMFLTHRGPEPSATADLEQEFREELPVGDINPIISQVNLIFPLQQAYPILFEICPLMMRTQGILLVRDTILLLAALPTDGESYTSTFSVCSV